MTTIPAYWLYNRLDVHVAASDDELMSALDAYADAHIIGSESGASGAAALTDAHRNMIRDQHAKAFILYGMVMSGRFDG